MSVNKINLAMSASSYGAYNQKLTQATKDKLNELGIPFTSSTTEDEAQALIQKYETAKESSLSEKKEENKSQTGSADQNKERLLSLAKRLGVFVDENLSFEEISSTVEKALNEQINANSDNQMMLIELKNASKELADIQAQNSNKNSASASNATNQPLMLSLEMLSQYNKNFINR